MIRLRERKGSRALSGSLHRHTQARTLIADQWASLSELLVAFDAPCALCQRSFMFCFICAYCFCWSGVSNALICESVSCWMDRSLARRSCCESELSLRVAASCC